MDFGVLTQHAGGPMPLIRTDFSSDTAWLRVVHDVTREWEGYEPNIAPVDEREFASLTPEGLAEVWPREHHMYVLLADGRSMSESSSGEVPTVVVLDLSAEDEDEEEFGWIFGRSFRAVATEIPGIEANLSEANMDFPDFADSVGDDAVFRGF